MRKRRVSKPKAEPSVEPSVVKGELPSAFEGEEAEDDSQDVAGPTPEDLYNIDDAEPTAEEPVVEQKPEPEPEQPVAEEAVARDAPPSEPTPAPEPVPVVPEFNPQDLARARGLGLSREQINAMGPQGLPLVLDGVEAAILREKSKPATPPTPEGETPPPKQQNQPTADDFSTGLDPEVFDPAVIKAFEKLNAHHRDQLQQLRQEVQSSVGGLRQAQLRQAQQEFEAQYDTWIDSLGPEWEPVFGKGRGVELDPKSEAHANRLAHIREMAAIAGVDRALGRPPLPLSELRSRAFRALHGHRMEEQTGNKIAATLKKNQKQFVARPTHRASSVADNPEQKAGVFVREFMRERGEHVGDDEFPESDGI